MSNVVTFPVIASKELLLEGIEEAGFLTSMIISPLGEMDLLIEPMNVCSQPERGVSLLLELRAWLRGASVAEREAMFVHFIQIGALLSTCGEREYEPSFAPLGERAS